jgi:hypothetical protein
LGQKVKKKGAQLFGLKRWEKVGRHELRLTPYKQEINPKTVIVFFQS